MLLTALLIIFSLQPAQHATPDSTFPTEFVWLLNLQSLIAQLTQDLIVLLVIVDFIFQAINVLPILSSLIVPPSTMGNAHLVTLDSIYPMHNAPLTPLLLTVLPSIMDNALPATLAINLAMEPV